MLRSIISTATTILSEAYDGQDDARELLDKAEKLIFEIYSKKV